MTIRICDRTYDSITLYRMAKTPAQRALVGYITKAGHTNDPIFGGAMHVLQNIEHCMDTNEVYELYNIVESETKKKILHIVQLALDGKLDRFAISERERVETLKNLYQPI